MPEIRSALAGLLVRGRYGAARPEGAGVTLSEVRGRTIIQAAGWVGAFDVVAWRLADAADCVLPEAFGMTGPGESAVTIAVGPERLWFVGADSALYDRLAALVTDEEAVLLDLSHSRTILAVEGPTARWVLGKGVPLDLHADLFPVGAAAQTVVDRTDVLIHRTGPDRFEIYIPRSYAAGFWHWLTAAAAETGYAVE